MSPAVDDVPADDERFPRVSGDEPVSHPCGWRAASFSPRERG